MNIIKKTFLAALLLLGLNSAQALEIAGQTVPDSVEVSGRTLVLNGAGKRVKVVFDVYVAALYTTAKTKDAGAVIGATEPRRVELRMLRNVEAATMLESFTEGMQANIGGDGMQKYAAQIAALKTVFEDAKSASKGDVIQIDFIPGEGTCIAIRGKKHPVIAGDDFAGAMLSIWLGREPAQSSLKKKMLGE